MKRTRLHRRVRTPAGALVVLAVATCWSPPSLAVLPFERTGHLYVSMWAADEIAVFADDGTPVTRFSADGLDGPRGLAFHPVSGELWVAGEFSDALYVFDVDHRLSRTIEHPDFDEPVAITFSVPGREGDPHEVYVSNSNGDEIMVFTEDGRLSRRFGDPSLRDPNCSALLPDGRLVVANRLGGSTGPGGAVARFDEDGRFEFDFTADGIVSTMAVARDPNVPGDALDDTLWVTSGAGTLGIHEFDVAGNLLRSVLPGDIEEGGDLVPQGIAFAGDGRFFVVSFRDAVFEFDGEGNFLSRFPTGPGTSRSTAFRRCDGDCVGAGGANGSGGDAGDSGDDAVVASRAGGGGTVSLWVLAALGLARYRRTG